MLELEYSYKKEKSDYEAAFQKELTSLHAELEVCNGSRRSLSANLELAQDSSRNMSDEVTAYSVLTLTHPLLVSYTRYVYVRWLDYTHSWRQTVLPSPPRTTCTRITVAAATPESPG